MELKTVKLGEITLDPNNARKHSEKNLAIIRASLEQFGQRKPIVVRNGVILAGNGTYSVAKDLGWNEITIVEVPQDWDAATAKAYALADNRSAELAEWDEGILTVALLDLSNIGFNIELLNFDVPVLPNFLPEEVEQPNLDKRTPLMCPSCAFEWRVGVKGEIEAV